MHQLLINCLLLLLLQSTVAQQDSNQRPMSNPNFRIIPLAGSPVSDLGEGPHWDPVRKELLYIDAFVGNVHRYDSATQKHHQVNLGDLVTIVIPVEGTTDQFVVSLRNKVIWLQWNATTGTHSHSVIAEVAPERAGKERFNDGKVDALGRLWIGTLLNAQDGSVVPGAGSLYRLDMNGKKGNFTKMSTNFTLSNGMAWNDNNTLMYFNDSEDRKTYVFDFDLPSGSISNKRILVDYAKDTDKDAVFASNEYPDGMAMDAEGRLWIAMYNGGRILQMDPSTGKVLASVAVPAPQTTSIAFGGDALSTLYVTTASSDVKGKPQLEAKYPNAGRIFALSRDVGKVSPLKGVKAFNFKE